MYYAYQIMIKAHLRRCDGSQSFGNCIYQRLLIDEVHMDPNTKNPDKGKPNPTSPSIMSLSELQ
jgi:hypothetical protein